MTEQQAPVVDTANAPVTPAADAPWYSSIQDEGIRGYAELKGWKDPASAIDSYRNLEKLRGVPENELARIPKEGDAEAWNQFYTKLGRPESAAGYEMPIPEGDDGVFAKAAAEWFHEAGLSPAQAKILAEKNNEYLASQVKAWETEVAARQDQEMTELKTTWGAAFDQNTEIARRGAKQFGVTEEVMEQLEGAMGTKGMLEFFHNIGSKLGEHKVEGMGASDASFKLSPAAAQERIRMLQSDREWSNKYLAGGSNEKAEMERLMRFAYPG